MQVTQAATQLNDLAVIDVRDDYEWIAGHIDVAVHMPMHELQARHVELDEATPILCVCRSGARSAMVTEALNNAGYTAHNLEGGMQAWAAAGLPFVAESGSPYVA